MDRVLSEAQIRPRLGQVPLEAIRAVWRGLCSTLSETLRTGRGITIENFGTFSFHLDYIDLGNIKKTNRTAVFELSDKFASHYHIRNPKQPAGISNTVPVKNLNLLAVANAAGQTREVTSKVMQVASLPLSARVFRMSFNRH